MAKDKLGVSNLTGVLHGRYRFLTREQWDAERREQAARERPKEVRYSDGMLKTDFSERDN